MTAMCDLVDISAVFCYVGIKFTRHDGDMVLLHVSNILQHMVKNHASDVSKGLVGSGDLYLSEQQHYDYFKMRQDVADILTVRQGATADFDVAFKYNTSNAAHGCDFTNHPGIYESICNKTKYQRADKASSLVRVQLQSL